MSLPLFVEYAGSHWLLRSTSLFREEGWGGVRGRGVDVQVEGCGKSKQSTELCTGADLRELDI